MLKPRLESFALHLIILVLVATPGWAADLDVQLDRTRLRANETLTMRLVAAGGARGEPDFTPLEQDFDILSQRQSKVTRILNGQMSHTREWTLELAPRRMGRLPIPALKLGSARSQALTIEVVDADDRGPGAVPKALSVHAESETQRPYVQQPFGYRVRVYFRQQPRHALLSEPVAEGGIIQRVGDDRGYDQVIDGVEYRVIERDYLVIAQRSGPLTIRGPRLEASLPDDRGGRRRDPFADLDEAFGGGFFQGFPGMTGLSGPTRRVIERASDLEIQVRAQPAGSGAPWLPATSVQISDEWTPSPPLFQVGEPVTRTLTITAQGTTAAQLPQLDLGGIEGAQVYPDQPQGEDLAGRSAPTALKRFKLALVPTRAGSMTLPEIRLHWWDTVADQARVAVVPARRVEVAAGRGAAAPPAPAAVGEALVDPAATAGSEPSAPVEPSRRSETGMSRGDAGLWPWLALVLGLAWLGTLGWWARERRSGRSPRGSDRGSGDGRAESLGRIRRQIEAACLAGDPRAARNGLLGWGQANWPSDAPRGLGELAIRLGGEAAPVLRAIDRALYAPSIQAWDGRAAWKELAPRLDEARRGSSARMEGPLPELYPRV